MDIFFACLNDLDVLLEEAKANYHEFISFTTTLDRVIGKVEIAAAASSSPVADYAQLLVLSSGPVLYRPSVVRAKLNKKSDGKTLQLVVAVEACRDEKRRQSPSRRMLKCLVKAPSVLFSFGLSFLFLSQTLDLCVLEAAWLWKAFAFPCLRDSRKSCIPLSL